MLVCVPSDLPAFRHVIRNALASDLFSRNSCIHRCRKLGQYRIRVTSPELKLRTGLAFVKSTCT